MGGLGLWMLDGNGAGLQICELQSNSGGEKGFCGPTGVSMGDREREGKGGRRFGVKKGEFGAANKGGADGGGAVQQTKLPFWG